MRTAHTKTAILRGEVRGSLTTFDYESLGLALAGRRYMRGIVQHTAAAEISVSTSTYNRMERGLPAHVEHTLRACEWLQLPLDSFVRRPRESQQEGTTMAPAVKPPTPHTDPGDALQTKYFTSGGWEVGRARISA